MASFYDAHWGRDFLDGALAMYAQWLAARLPASGARLLDVCCGTGEFAAWASSAHAVVGIDLSGPMLEIARNKAPRARFEQKDMRTFRLAERDFDAAVCFYNSLNQAMTPRGLLAALRSVQRHLRPGGWFLFDYIDEDAFASSWDFEETAIAGGEVCRLRYRYNPATRIATCRANIGGGGDNRTIVRQRPISRTEIEAALAESGFVVESIGVVTNVNPSRGRSAVLCRRG